MTYSFLVRPCLADQSLTLVSFNLGLAKAPLGIKLVPCYRARRRLLAKVFPDYFQKTDVPQILLLQEVYDRSFFRHLKKAAQRHQWSLVPKHFSAIKKNGLIILSNQELFNDRFYRFSSDQFSTIQRGLLFSNLILGGKSVSVINTHTAYSLDKNPSPVHLAQLEQTVNLVKLLKNAGKEYLFLGGDFNIGPDYSLKHQQYDPIELIWSPFSQQIKEMGYHFNSYALAPSWNERLNPLVARPAFFVRLFASKQGQWTENTSSIDHLFIPDDLIIKDSRLVFNRTYRSNRRCRGQKETYLSDHFGVLKTVVF
jgi:endonuclease/exonuclease/phosphatase family metal-dependent hydrolase